MGRIWKYANCAMMRICLSLLCANCCNITCFNMQTNNIGSGLQNLGNTCFFNATLQSLLYAPPLALLFQEHGHSSLCKRRNSSEWCVFCEMEKIYSNTRQCRIFSPNNMIKNLGKIFKKFRLGRQEDSHQFLRYLIEGMQETETGKLGKEREENEKKIRKTRIFDIFGGITKTCVECLGCGHKSLTTQRYYDFNISQECQRASSLHEGVSSFFAIDKLEGSNKYLCEHCKVRSNARKQFLLETVPQVATFQLKRFTNSMRKIGKFIQYPLQIDLGKYLEQPKKIAMKLFAVIVHLGGSSFSGHYFAFVRQGNLWFKMDDGYVSKSNLQSVMNQQAYILFYEREVTKQQNNNVHIVEEKMANLKKKEQTKKKEVVEVQSQKKKEQTPQMKEISLLNGHANGILSNKSKELMNKEVPKEEKEESKEKQEISEPLLQNIQNLLLHKLAESDMLKKMETENPEIGDAISKAVKEVISEFSPKKKQENQPGYELNESMDIQLPGLNRRKSKEQMERDMPMSELILRTLEKIMDLQSKMPLRRPHNFSQRSMYNLRKYETKMQKRRKIG